MADTLAGNITEIGGSIPYVEDDGDLWDRCVLGEPLPGVWTVRGSSKRRIDVKGTKGQDGARFKDQGYQPARLTVTGKLVGADAWNEMVRAAKRLTPRARGVAMEPLACEHPAFSFLGISNVYVDEVFAPVINHGEVTCAMTVLEWMRKPKKKKEAKDIPLSFVDGSIQRAARDAPWAVKPSAELDQFNIDGDLQQLPGLEPAP